jgi:hypothetical protein
MAPTMITNMATPGSRLADVSDTLTSVLLPMAILPILVVALAVVATALIVYRLPSLAPSGTPVNVLTPPPTGNTCFPPLLSTNSTESSSTWTESTSPTPTSFDCNSFVAVRLATLCYYCAMLTTFCRASYDLNLQSQRNMLCSQSCTLRLSQVPRKRGRSGLQSMTLYGKIRRALLLRRK